MKKPFTPYPLFTLANTLIAVTGLAYAAVKYLVRPDDPMAVANHPSQPHLLHAHILAAPVFALILGWFWPAHAWRHIRIRTEEGRLSGYILTGLLAVMIGSGYLIQVAVHPAWRLGWAWCHGISSLLWLMVLAMHWRIHQLTRRG